MIQLTTAAKLENAIAKARTVKPRVRVNCFGSYTVTNKQTGATYSVECLKQDGKRFAHCSCEAGKRERAATTWRPSSASTSSLQRSAPRDTKRKG